MTGRSSEGGRGATHRYGAVLGLTLVLLVFGILAPAAPWARAVALLLEGTALVVVVATSRERASVRRVRVRAVAAGSAAVVIAVAADVLPRALTFAIAGLLAGSIAAALVVGAARLVRARGVSLEVVAAGLAIYLLLGLVFAWVIRLVSELGTSPYFSGGHAAGGGVTVYYSFTTLTTTGYGDYVAATSVGRALAVLEMLLGQLYLVTVIGVLVGGLAGARRR